MAKRLPDGWKHTYCTLIAEGYTRTDAAKATGVALGTVNRHAAEDDDFRDLYQTARESVRDQLRNRIWAMGMSATDVDAATTRWALDHLIKWNLPEAIEKTRFEITGDGGGPVAIEHEQRLTLAHLLAFAGAVPGFGGSTGNELSAAQNVLSAPEDDRAAAGALPRRSES